MTLREMLELIDIDTQTYIIFSEDVDVSSSDAQNLLHLIADPILNMTKVKQIGCEDDQIKIWTE